MGKREGYILEGKIELRVKKEHKLTRNQASTIFKQELQKGQKYLVRRASKNAIYDVVLSMKEIQQT